jgi:hypothetical protein
MIMRDQYDLEERIDMLEEDVEMIVGQLVKISEKVTIALEELEKHMKGKNEN